MNLLVCNLNNIYIMNRIIYIFSKVHGKMQIFIMYLELKEFQLKEIERKKLVKVLQQ